MRRVYTRTDGEIRFDLATAIYSAVYVVKLFMMETPGSAEMTRNLPCWKFKGASAVKILIILLLLSASSLAPFRLTEGATSPTLPSLEFTCIETKVVLLHIFSA
jgi:hypothetical protein